MVKRILRALVICLLAVPFFWFGLRYSQPPTPAYGEIFRELSQPLFLRHRYLQPERPALGWRLSQINGSPIYYRVGKAQRDIRTLFDLTERSVSSGPAESPASNPSKAAAPATDPGNLLRPLPIFRLEWPDWGTLGFALPSGASQRAAADLLPTESAGQLDLPPAISPGGLLAVVAFFNREEGATTYLTFWFDGSFDFANIFPKSGVDSPGRDAPGVARYPGLQRQYAFEERGDAFESIMVVYNGRGNFHEVANFYRGRMVGLGWEMKATTPNREGKKSEEVLFFTQRGRECVIYAGSAPSPGLVQVIISVREAG